MKSKYTIITDPGIDDLIALLLLNKLVPNQKNTAIATFGNVPQKYTEINLKKFISFVTPKWSYKKGATKPIKPLEYPWPDYFHGPDGVWGIYPTTKNQAIENNEGKISNKIISLGPMTTVFDIMQKNQIKEITIMGGSIKIPGNETKYAETNIAFDPDAANYFFDNCQGIKVKLIPLDVTKKVFWEKDKIIKIPENNEINIWAKKLLLAWFKNYGDTQRMNFDLHDPLAIYSIFFPENIKWMQGGIRVIKSGTKRGATIIDKKNPKCNIAIDLNYKSITEEIFNLIFQ